MTPKVPKLPKRSPDPQYPYSTTTTTVPGESIQSKNEYTDFIFQENKESTIYYKKESLIEIEKLRDKWKTTVKNARKDWLARQFNK